MLTAGRNDIARQEAPARPRAAEDAPAPCGGRRRAGSLDVYSCGVGPLPAEVQAARPDHVFGSRALLDRLPDAGAARHDLKPSPAGALEAALALAEAGAAVSVLASGDALYHGLGGTLTRLLRTRPAPAVSITFHPGVTAFQTLCHRLGLPWDRASLFYAHTGAAALRPMLEAELAVIYAGCPLTGAKLAGALCALHPASGTRRCVLAERLGTEAERIFEGTLQEAARTGAGPTSILMLFPDGGLSPTLPLGLPDTAWDREGHCLTAREVRPLVISCLRLPARGVLWDLGAGSGSVGIEAGLLRPGLRVHAVERAPARCANIRANLARHACGNVTLHESGIAECLERLPAPDRVFVGGGGRDLGGIVSAALARLNPDDPDAVCCVTTISLESCALLQRLPDHRPVEVISVDAARSTPMAGGWTRLAPLIRIHIHVFRPGPRAAR